MRRLRALRKLPLLWYHILHTAHAYRALRRSAKPPTGEQVTELGHSIGSAARTLYADPWETP